jgi:ubiquinone/menaquinone biosynthesis C-methylase UbiE
MMSSGYIKFIVIIILAVTTISFFLPAITILLGSMFFKFRERDWLFDQLALKGNETVLDVGCGHGLLLIAAAKRIKSGKAIGIDLWVQADQADNSQEATLMNAKVEGVQDKVEIHSGDMRKLPLADKSIDVVVSSWAIHNIYDEQGREAALSEIKRVLKPEGRFAILDIDHAPSYREYFIKQGMQDVKLLGPRYTFGNKTYLVLGKV